MIEQRLDLKQTQQLTFVPQLQQAMRLLTMQIAQLVEQAELEIEENPALEIVETEDEKELDDTEDFKEGGEIEWESFLSFVEDYVPEEPENEEVEKYENYATPAPSLHQYLLQQLHLQNLSNEELAIGELLINLVDPDGYIRQDPKEISRELNLPIEKINGVLKVIKSLDPPGVGSKTLEEALIIQAEDIGILTPTLQKLILNHLRDIRAKKYEKIKKALDIDDHELQELIHKISSSLEPKPGRLYSSSNVRYIVPDIIVKKKGEDFTIELNEEWIPQVRVSPYFKQLLRQEKSREVKKFLRDRVNSAIWFVKCIDQRRQTLLSVARTIFKKQWGFLKDGPEGIVPLKLEDIARILDIHESTVGRAIQNKYAQTPHGVFPLKFFFSSGLRNKKGLISSRAIKEKIKEMIENESPEKPLSDEAISAALAKEGINISRRTVTKYRKQMHLLSSAYRKS
jgi:RNA polymerase sigma-54 factor